MRTRWLVLAMSVLALVLVAGCGDDDDDENGDGAATTTQPAPAETAPADTGEETAPAGGEELSLSAPADGSLEFDKTELTAPAGEVTINFDNMSSSVPHNVTIEETDDATETVTGDTTALTTELEAGEYTFFCSVGGHRQAGMEGTLTVE